MCKTEWETESKINDPQYKYTFMCSKHISGRIEIKAKSSCWRGNEYLGKRNVNKNYSILEFCTTAWLLMKNKSFNGGVGKMPTYLINVIEKSLCPLIYILFVAGLCFTAVGATEAIWPAKLKIFTICHYKKRKKKVKPCFKVNEWKFKKYSPYASMIKTSIKISLKM